MQERFINAHMCAAFVYAQLSHCKRRKVGCVIVKNNKIISIGYNGTPSGWNNLCEDSNGVSLRDVIHAEINAIGKLAADGGNGRGSSLFVTRICCIDCAKVIGAMEAKDVYYCHEGSTGDREGAEYLRERCKIPVYKTKEPHFPNNIKPLVEADKPRWLQQLLTIITRKSNTKNERRILRNKD